MLAMIAASSAVVIELRLLGQTLQLCLVSMSTIRAVSAKAAIMLMLR